MGGVTQSWALGQLVRHHPSPPWAARAPRQEDSCWVCPPPSIWPCMPAGCKGPAVLERARQDGQPGKASTAMTWDPGPERFQNIQEKKKHTPSTRELCLTSTSVSNKSALKMYKGIKHNGAHRRRRNPFLPHPVLPASALRPPGESLQPRETTVHTDPATSLDPGQRQGTERWGKPGGQLAPCRGRQSPWGSQVRASTGKSTDRAPPCSSPKGGCRMSPQGFIVPGLEDSSGSLKGYRGI